MSLAEPKCISQVCVDYLPEDQRNLETLADTQSRMVIDKSPDRTIEIMARFFHCPACHTTYKRVLTADQSQVSYSELEQYEGALTAGEIKEHSHTIYGPFITKDDEKRILTQRGKIKSPTIETRSEKGYSTWPKEEN